MSVEVWIKLRLFSGKFSWANSQNSNTQFWVWIKVSICSKYLLTLKFTLSALCHHLLTFRANSSFLLECIHNTCFFECIHCTVKPLYTVPLYTVFLDIPCTVFFPQIACLAVFTRKTYLDIPCTSIYRAFFVSPKKHGISRNYCNTIKSKVGPYLDPKTFYFVWNSAVTAEQFSVNLGPKM